MTTPTIQARAVCGKCKGSGARIRKRAKVSVKCATCAGAGYLLVQLPAAEMDRIIRERDVLRTTATTFLARFDELMPHVIGFITTACLRVGINDWGYGDWTNELTAFRAALAASVVTKEEE